MLCSHLALSTVLRLSFCVSLAFFLLIVDVNFNAVLGYVWSYPIKCRVFGCICDILFLDVRWHWIWVALYFNLLVALHLERLGGIVPVFGYVIVLWHCIFMCLGAYHLDILCIVFYGCSIVLLWYVALYLDMFGMCWWYYIWICRQHCIGCWLCIWMCWVALSLVLVGFIVFGYIWWFIFWSFWHCVS